MKRARPLLLLLLACSSDRKVTPDAAPPHRAVTSPDAAPADLADDSPIGVPTCDAFVAAYAHCVDGQVPAEARPTMQKGVRALRAAFRRLAHAGSEAEKEALGDSCRRTAAATDAIVARYGCSLLSALARPDAGTVAPAEKPAGATQENAGPLAFPEETGIAFCDAFVRRYLTCIRTKVPPSERDGLIQNLLQTSRAWSRAAHSHGPQGRESVASACRKLAETARTVTGPLGCVD